MNGYEGVFPVIPAPFTEDKNTIDYQNWERLVEYAIDAGSSGIAIFGAGTEFYKLSAVEKQKMLKIAVEACRKRVPILATISSHATVLAIDEAKQAVDYGADIINIFPPSFAAPSPEAIIKHVMRIIEAVDVPVMIQYAPELTGQKIALQAFSRISEEVERELLIKVEANPIGPTISAVHKATQGRYSMAVGNAGLHMYDALLRGAQIIMPGLAMVERYISFYRTFSTGNHAEAYRDYASILPYIVALGQDIEMFVALEKMILKEKGLLSSSVCREPNRIPDDTTVRIAFQSIGSKRGNT
jgi:4-hydroxy-tetrahydrodipicolinate synthase